MRLRSVEEPDQTSAVSCAASRLAPAAIQPLALRSRSRRQEGAGVQDGETADEHRPWGDWSCALLAREPRSSLERVLPNTGVAARIALGSKHCPHVDVTQPLVGGRYRVGFDHLAQVRHVGAEDRFAAAFSYLEPVIDSAQASEGGRNGSRTRLVWILRDDGHAQVAMTDIGV